MRDNDSLKHVHLVAVTGYGQEEDLRHARQAGFEMHLTKPVNPRTLDQILTDLTARVL